MYTDMVPAVNFTTQRWKYRDGVEKLSYLQKVIMCGWIAFNVFKDKKFDISFHRAVIDQYFMESMRYDEPDGDIEETDYWYAFERFEGPSTVNDVAHRLNVEDRREIADYIGTYHKLIDNWKTRCKNFMEGDEDVD